MTGLISHMISFKVVIIIMILIIKIEPINLLHHPQCTLCFQPHRFEVGAFVQYFLGPSVNTLH